MFMLHVFVVCLCLFQADQKLREEDRRARKYLESRKGCNSVQQVMVAVAMMSLPV